jgi:lipopolysaccharide/colanic/teichoic acid biosynthesis glycosyltransferase
VKLTKRLFDIGVSLAGLLLLSPVFVIIAILIKTQDGGPIFFRHQRIGRYGKAFYMWKFRTMVSASGNAGPELTVAGDRRITTIGAWLRRQKLDELPQLVNVLAGEMTFVGPRPEVPKYVAMYTPDQRKVLDLSPGITDKASIAYANESVLLADQPDPERYYCDQVVPDKIRINLEYSRHANLIDDLTVVMDTLRTCASSRATDSRASGEAISSGIRA